MLRRRAAPAPIPDRSAPRLSIATRQPSPTAPSTADAGSRQPSKNTSLKSDVPVISRSGRTSMPGSRMSTMNALMPRWRSSGVPVRASRKPKSDHAALLLQPSARRRRTRRRPRGARAHRPEVAAGVGLAEQLAPRVAPLADPRQVPRLLLLGAEVDQRERGQVRLVGERRKPRARHLFADDQVVHGIPIAAPTPLRRPVRSEVARVVERGAPGEQRALLLLVVRAAEAGPDRQRRPVGAQERADLLAERLAHDRSSSGWKFQRGGSSASATSVSSWVEQPGQQ